MPAITYVHIVDVELGKHVIKRMPTIIDAVRFVHNFDLYMRSVVVYAVRYDEVLAFKSSILAYHTILSDKRDLLKIDQMRKKQISTGYAKVKI